MNDPGRRRPSGGAARSLEQTATAPGEISAVRRAVTAYLDGCGCSNSDDAVLVLSELVTNAVLHAGGADRIAVECDGGSIRISVRDGTIARPAVQRASSAIGGRGLRIVDTLAERWGCDDHAGGKTVWAVLPCSTRAG
jgi:anti-sigma regulatory factor (Ser/Thr protein kinase)